MTRKVAPMKKPKHAEPITIFRGDDTDFVGNRIIEISLDTDIDLSGITARFELCGFTQEFDNEAVAGKRLEVVIDHDTTKTLPLGAQNGSLVLFDASGKIKHVDTCIPFIVTNTTAFPRFTGDEQITCELRTKVKWSDISDTPTTLEGYGIEDAATSEELSEVKEAVSELDRSVVKTVNGKTPDENGNVEIETGGGGTTDYNVLENKPSINGNTLSGNKTASDLGLASGSDLEVLRQFYLEEKRKIDPRFGVADNISVVIGDDGNRYEVVTEGEFVPTTYGQGAHAKEIYLAPTVNAIGADVNMALVYTQKIVCYGNITSISQSAFIDAYILNFLSLAGAGQTDAVANGNVNFSMCDSAILVVIPDTYYQDETSAFWNWADYTEAGGVNYLRMHNFAKESDPRRNPYIVETSYALSNGEQEKSFIIPDYQWDIKWAKRWGENFFFPEGEEIGSIMLNDICGAADIQFNNQATLSSPSVYMGYVRTSSADFPLPSGFAPHYGGATIEVVVSGFNGYPATVDFGGMKIEGRTLQILDPSGNEVSLSANSIGESLTSFVFRVSRAGASFQWLLNLGRSIFTTPDEWADMGDYDFFSDGMTIYCDNGQAPFFFHALRIYDAILTDAQIMEHARLDAERFNLTKEF